DRMVELIAAKFGIPLDELQLPIAVAVQAADGVLDLAFRIDPNGEQRVLDEAKSMIRGYLSTRLPN
ncbi:MAG: TetR/AcrR family transcriptional regulator, partial [Umezawaea sp.]